MCNDDSIPIVLDLVDQLHGLRRIRPREVLATMKTQQERSRTPRSSRLVSSPALCKWHWKIGSIEIIDGDGIKQIVKLKDQLLLYAENK